MKEPKCKVCGGKHYAFQCWQKPKTVPKTKMPVKRISSPLEATKRKKTIKLSSQKENHRKTLVKRLDKLTSEYVRRSFANKQGIVLCYTCGSPFHWKNLDCGHFIKRRYLNTRWELQNLRPQCRTCNRTLGGNYEVYNRKMIRELGEDGVQKLWDKAYSDRKIPTVELELMIEKMEIRLKLLDLS